jgi:glycosyltransferase involved in cell wall biosynthesis
MKAVVAFSNLRWDPFCQRPQHVLSRIARRWRVIFIEEPVPGSERNEIEVFEPVPGVQVWRPHVTGAAPGFHDDHLPALQKLLGDAMGEQAVTDYWLWFCTPMALPLAAQLRPRGVVYDCMDDLAAFRNAPRQIVQRENALFKIADLVFTGGHSIHNAKRSRHPDVHCFAGSVDAQHFANVAGAHPLHADIPRPRLGYCGPIDERVNLVLLDAIARERPDWNIVMVGPAVKIDPLSLPRRDNIHWLGPRSYDELPALISGWDVCLLPFALTDATRSLSPTQALEYMACGRPSVSTSIRDVAERYGPLVRIADTPEGFVADCEMIMQRTADERAAHEEAMAHLVARSSWDSTVQAMADLVAEADEAVDDYAQSAMPLPKAVQPEAKRATAVG